MNLRDHSPKKSSASEWALPGHRNCAGRDSNADDQTESGYLCILFPSTLTPSSTSFHHTIPSPSFCHFLLSFLYPSLILQSTLMSPSCHTILPHHLIPSSSVHCLPLPPLILGSVSVVSGWVQLRREQRQHTESPLAWRANQPPHQTPSFSLSSINAFFFNKMTRNLDLCLFVSLISYWSWYRDVWWDDAGLAEWLQKSWMCGVGLMSRGSESVTPAWLVARQGRMTASGNSVSHNQTYR